MTEGTYLPHLDGLRAVALAGVLLFHFQVRSFGGGFAGVDVFLSLSGFLITRNIARSLANQTFSLPSFYIRRFYRLYPASLVTVAFAIVFALLAFPPPLTESTAFSGLAALFFNANTYFHAKANYFDAAAITKPLLHMWSLSLEEQFYFLWAPFLVLIYRFSKSFKVAAAVLVVLFAASLGLGTVLYSTRSSFVFFHLPARIFQFTAGALVAMLSPPRANTGDNFGDQKLQREDLESSGYEPVSTKDDSDQGHNGASKMPNDVSASKHEHVDVFAKKRPVAVRVAREIVGLTAVATLFASYVLLPEEASPLLMTPTTIATCIILMLPDTLLSRYILSNPVLRNVGHVSYSAYLIHWPLWVFSVHLMGALHMGYPNPIVMVTATIVCAGFLRETVETPCRQRKHGMRIGVSTLVVIGVAVMIILTNGDAFRFGNVDFDLSNKHQALKFFQFCRDETNAKSEILAKFHVRTCHVGDLSGSRSKYAFFGDSFTLHLAGALDEIGKRRNEWYELHFQSGCTFYPESERPKIKKKHFNCINRHDELWNELKALRNGSVVAVANSWATESLSTNIFPRLISEIKAAGYRTAMVAEPPGLSHREESYFDCADLAVMPISRLWQILRTGNYEGAKRCANFESGLLPHGGRLHQAEAYRSLARNMSSVKLIEIFDQLCSDEDDVWRCKVPRMSKIVYDIGYRRDRRHLTVGGSLALSEIYEKAIYESKNSSS